LTGELTAGMTFGIIAGALVLIGLIVFVVIILGKKKSPAAVPASEQATIVEAPVTQAAPVPAASAYVKGVTGTLAGKKFNIDGKIFFGRDSGKCAVAFPLDTAGISGIHCEIAIDGTTAYLRDLGSSYGTFLANGTKLAPKTPVRIATGDRFYLAGEDNTFEFGM
jgi:pSer/pThr/pTyr-binding forkhead associated (FHA) protein